jgi:hypothetical protein
MIRPRAFLCDMFQQFPHIILSITVRTFQTQLHKRFSTQLVEMTDIAGPVHHVQTSYLTITERLKD